MLFHNLNGTSPLLLIVRVGGKLLCQLFFGFIWFSWYELGGFLGVEGLDRKTGVRGKRQGFRKGGAGVQRDGGRQYRVAAPCGLCSGLRQCGSVLRTRLDYGTAKAVPLKDTARRPSAERIRAWRPGVYGTAKAVPLRHRDGYGPRERVPFRFLTQRAARSRAGFEAPSKRRVWGGRLCLPRLSLHRRLQLLNTYKAHNNSILLEALMPLEPFVIRRLKNMSVCFTGNCCCNKFLHPHGSKLLQRRESCGNSSNWHHSCMIGCI